MAKHSSDILTWARRGAEARWNELQAELASLAKTFPDLGRVARTSRRAVGTAARSMADTVDPQPARRRRRRTMSPAQRKAVSARMKKYWAARRATKK
jgi:hypothetical protein